jgi:hypothetical protein
LIHARDTSKDLIGKICFRLCKVNSSFLWLISKQFTPPRIDDIDDRLSSSMICK